MSETVTSSTGTPAAPAATQSASAQTSTPPAAPSSAPQTSAAVGGEQTTDWKISLTDELRGYATSKGFKDPAAVLESYRNFEKLQGVPADRLLKLPENLDAPEAATIWEKLGKPKDPADYSITVAEEAGGEEVANWLRDVATKSNLTQKQVEKFVNEWNDRSINFQKAQQQKELEAYQIQEGNLKREWGVAFDKNLNLAKQAVSTAGISKEEVDVIEGAIGYEKTMKLLAKLGSATGEAGFVRGDAAGSGLLSTDQAKSRIKELMQDSSFTRRYASGDVEARKQMDRLHEMAFPGTRSL